MWSCWSTAAMCLDVRGDTGTLKARQRGLLGQQCYKWLDSDSDLSVSVLPHAFPMFWISLSIEITELTSSQNHRMVGVGRDLCRSSSPTLLPKQGHLQQAAEDLVQEGLEYLQSLAWAQSWLDHRPTGLLWLPILHLQHPASDSTRQMFPSNVPTSQGWELLLHRFFLEIGLLGAQGLWNRGWNMLFDQKSCVSCHIRGQNRSCNHALLGPLGVGSSGIFQERELVSPSFSTLPAMQIATQRLLRKKPVMMISDCRKQHLVTKYYEISRPQKKIAEVAGADTSFAFMWLSNLPWPAKFFERMLLSELQTEIL